MATRLQLPATSSLLTQGGDGRIALAAGETANSYGCRPTPDPDMVALSSSTATSVSRRGYAAADQLRRKLLTAPNQRAAKSLHDAELEAIRQELSLRCGLATLPETAVLLAASGTDIHLMASSLMSMSGPCPPMIIMMEASETGSGVVNALRGQHFNSTTARGRSARVGTALTGTQGQPSLVQIAVRMSDGSPRPPAAMEAEIESWICRAALIGQSVLLVTLDVSKTGLLVPSADFVVKLRRHWPELVNVMIDASQFRLSPATLHAYVREGCLVTVTGSKFLTGPSFCGALFVPAHLAKQWRELDPGQTQAAACQALANYSGQSDWPADWRIRGTQDKGPNYGLLLRWKAALAELRAFQQVQPGHVRHLLKIFGAGIQRRLDDSPAFERLLGHGLHRALLVPQSEWDSLTTIFPFVLHRIPAQGHPVPLNKTETLTLHRLMQMDLSELPRHLTAGIHQDVLRTRFQLGQPVACGTRQGVAVHALRLCISSRMVVEATSQGGQRVDAVLRRTLSALDKAEWLCRSHAILHNKEFSHAA